MTRPQAARAARGVAAFVLLVAGVAFIYWPAALIVGGLLLLLDILTT